MNSNVKEDFELYCALIKYVYVIISLNEHDSVDLHECLSKFCKRSNGNAVMTGKHECIAEGTIYSHIMNAKPMLNNLQFKNKFLSSLCIDLNREQFKSVKYYIDESF